MSSLPGFPVPHSPPPAATLHHADGASSGGRRGRGQTVVRRPRQRRATSAISGQYFQDRTESEASVLARIAGARKEAADAEKALNVEMLRSAREEAVARKEILHEQKKREAVEVENAKIKRARLQSEFVTAELKKYLIIVQFNQATGRNVPLPDLPTM
jgi:hypothetical protein